MVGITAYTFMRNMRLTKYFDRWLISNRGKDRDYVLYARTAKLAEEVGEVMQAVIGFLGDNPRKGVTHTLDDIQCELADVVITAMCAMASINNDPHAISHTINERMAFIESRLAEREDYNATTWI